MAIAGGLIFFYTAPTPTLGFATLSVTPGPIRGVASSLYTLSAQVIGYGTGPTAVALCTDRLFGNPKMVGHSLQIVCCCAAILTGALFYTCLPHYRQLMVVNSDTADEDSTRRR
jgi:MFS transporter, Spinster family, sphingosine-1-phosphate transporter